MTKDLTLLWLSVLVAGLWLAAYAVVRAMDRRP